MLRILRRINAIIIPQQIRIVQLSNGGGGGGASGGKSGSGGAGGKGGASAAESDGNVDKIQAAREEEFFRKQRNEQLKKLKSKKPIEGEKKK
ncbi:ATPase inhibitor mai-1, mitochondrial [Musca domestica]|uniref:ATPase inhibitor mai-1, mitochondrial n=1 Tax=Musca domestica TaxID=7370 RepID=A0A1I8N752_MUSDO|nr:ATPase inhibitor mai-1, mitochondrial [Musca domestica]